MRRGALPEGLRLEYQSIIHLIAAKASLLGNPHQPRSARGRLGGPYKLGQQQRTVWLQPGLAGNCGGLALKDTHLSVTNVAPCNRVA